MPTSSTRNVKLGVCRVYFDGADLGITQGGVEVSVSTETHRVEVDQFGKTAINEIIMGRTVSAKAPLAETTIRNMVAIMPGATLVSDGAVASGTVTFAAIPTAATTVTIGGQAFTFQVGTATTLFQTKILATKALTLAAFCETVNRALLQSVYGYLTASLDAATQSVVTIKAGDPGTGANAVTLAAASGGVASGATLIGGVAETKARVEVATGIGSDLLAMARVLRLHPTAKADSDFSDDFVIYLAATSGALTFAYKLDQERIYNAEFMAYPDATGKLYSVGDLVGV